MKNYICIVAGVAMTIANFTSSVQAGFQTYQYETGCAFNLEHETTSNSGTGVSNTVAPSTTNTQTNTTVPTNTNQPVNTVPQTTIIGNIGECPDPGYGGGSVALALFGGIFLGIIISAGALVIIVTRIAGTSIGDALDKLGDAALTPINDSEIGNYGTFELEPTYYPESDAPGIKFSFKF